MEICQFCFWNLVERLEYYICGNSYAVFAAGIFWEAGVLFLCVVEFGLTLEWWWEVTCELKICTSLMGSLSSYMTSIRPIWSLYWADWHSIWQHLCYFLLHHFCSETLTFMWNWQWANSSGIDKCSFCALETSRLFQAYAKSVTCKSNNLAFWPCRYIIRELMHSCWLWTGWLFYFPYAYGLTSLSFFFFFFCEELYQQMLAKGLAHYFDAKLLILDVIDFALKVSCYIFIFVSHVLNAVLTSRWTLSYRSRVNSVLPTKIL